MAVLVDPPQRGSAADRSAAGQRPSPEDTLDALDATDATDAPEELAAGSRQSGTMTVARPAAAKAAAAKAPPLTPPPAPVAPKLAEPPIPGGRVEAMMGVVIRVLAHSPLARPLPAVTLSALGIGGVAFVGLCATAPRPSVATPPVLLPLTSVARDLGAPHLPDIAANLIMYVSIGLCCLGLAMMLWANSRGWSPSPRKVFAAAAGTVAVLVNITPVGSSDAASYAAYGRLAALGFNPYLKSPIDLPGHGHNPYTMVVNPLWQGTQSVYGPVATWMHLLAALTGGAKPWATIWVLMIMVGVAFLAAGYVLLRTAENPVRAVLIWVANPLLIAELVMGGHLDAFVALFAIVAIVLSRRGSTIWHDLLVGICVGVAGAIKVSAIFVALGIAIPLLHDRAWARLARIGSVAALTTFGLYYFSYGFSALKPLSKASTWVISPTVWRLVQEIGKLIDPSTHAQALVTTMIGFAWPPLMLALAWYLYNRLSPDVPAVVAATCALTFAWVLVAPWALPWYASVAWVTLALLPRNSLTRWLTLATGVLSLLHFNGGHYSAAAPSP
jgi:hypothetical protein